MTMATTPLSPQRRPAAIPPGSTFVQVPASADRKSVAHLHTPPMEAFRTGGFRMDRIKTMELVQAYQSGRMSRREFGRGLVIALGSVAAADLLLAACAPITPAPRPVVAEPTAAGVAVEGVTHGTLPEAPAGVATQDVTYTGPGGSVLSGYLAAPDDGAAHPGVIVIQEWWGLNDHIKDVANRFAAAGYVALAPDLYHGVAATEPDEARKLVMQLDQAAAVDEIGAAMRHLLALENVSGESVGVVGFCMGGGLAGRTAIGDDNALVGATVIFYGQPLAEHEGARAHGALLGLFGEADGGIPATSVAAMQRGLEAAGVPVETVIYPGAQHAFFNDTRASYHSEAAKDAWQRTLAWFATHL